MTRLLTRVAPLLLLGIVLPVVAEGSVYSDFVIGNTSPVLYWNLDETSGTTATDLVPAGGANNGTYMTGTTLGQAGPRPSDGFTHMGAGNNAPGAGQPVGVRYPSLGTIAGVAGVPYSAQTWFNSSVPFTNNVLNYFLSRGDDTTNPNLRDSVGVWGNFESNPAKANRLFLFPGPAGSPPGSVVGTTVLSPDTWYHALIVRDSTSARVYLNGTLELVSAWPWAGGGGGTGNEFRSGTRADAAHGLNGRTDEVAVWDRALSAHEANLLYHYAISPPYALAVLRDDPAAYWRLNETVGDNTATDFSGKGKHQTLGNGLIPNVTRSGAPPDVGPRPGDIVGGLGIWGFEPTNNAPTQPVGLAGYTANDYAVLVGAGSDPGVVVPEDDYTVELWARPSAVTGGVLGYLYQRRDFDGSSGTGVWDSLGMATGHETAPPGVLFFFDGTNVLKNTSDPMALEAGGWYHIALARDGDDVTCYLNGEVEFAGTSAAHPTGSFDQGTWTFGGRSEHGALKWPGTLDEIAIYGRALTQDEILRHYYAGVVPEPTTLALLGLSGLGLLARRRRRREK